MTRASATHAAVEREAKARGAYFTPPEVSAFLAGWAIREGGERVLEPSCGEASFLIAAARRLSTVGHQGRLWGGSIVGFDVHPESIDRAARKLADAGVGAELRCLDFLAAQCDPSFDVVLGNPPYIRYQSFTGDSRESGLRAALAAGVNLSGLASSWAPFVVHASRFLRAGGRLGMVLPAELLSVNYAAPVRRYLMQRFGSVRLVVFENLVFPGALEDVVLLLAEGIGGCDHFEVSQVRDASDLTAQGRISWSPVSVTGAEKWSHALVESDGWEAYQHAVASEEVETLGDWGSVYLGSVTGDNDYFTLSAEAASAAGLVGADLVPISPPGSRHIRGLEFSAAAWQDLSRGGARCWLFRPRDGRLSAAAARFVQAGQRAGVHRRYKCSVRAPWYCPPLVPVADLLLTYMDQERPRLVANSAGVRHLNSVYGVTLGRGRKQLGKGLLPLAALNSLTLLGAELVGRSYGGGMLKLEPAEAERIPFPSLELMRACHDGLVDVRARVGSELRSGRAERAVDLVDAVIIESSRSLTRSTMSKLRAARAALAQRRLSRGRSVRPAHGEKDSR